MDPCKVLNTVTRTETLKTGPLSPLLSVDTFEMRRSYLTPPLAKLISNAEAIFTKCEFFVCGCAHYIITYKV